MKDITGFGCPATTVIAGAAGFPGIMHAAALTTPGMRGIAIAIIESGFQTVIGGKNSVHRIEMLQSRLRKGSALRI